MRWVRRALRGGSWGNFPCNASVLCRGKDWANYRYLTFGFRLVIEEKE